MSVYEQDKRCSIAMRFKDSQMLSKDEKTMVYYLVNLILFKQYNMANSLCEKHYLKMKNDQCSHIYKANVRRL